MWTPAPPSWVWPGNLNPVPIAVSLTITSSPNTAGQASWASVAGLEKKGKVSGKGKRLHITRALPSLMDPTRTSCLAARGPSQTLPSAAAQPYWDTTAVSPSLGAPEWPGEYFHIKDAQTASSLPDLLYPNHQLGARGGVEGMHHIQKPLKWLLEALQGDSEVQDPS